MWMCCTSLPLDLSGENAASYRTSHPVTLLADLLHLFKHIIAGAHSVLLSCFFWHKIFLLFLRTV